MEPLPEIPEKTVLTGRPASGKGKEFPRVRKFSYESPQKLKQLERAFVLDGVALSKQSNDETGRSNPSVNLGIPQYNPLTDKHCKSYFKKKGLPEDFSKPNLEKEKRSSMAGSMFDEYMKTTEAWGYMQNRQSIGAGYTRSIYGGHTTIPTDPLKPGYHGEEGYRKNTPDLRRKKSVFDYEDPFDNPPILKRFPRTTSAPATMRILRRKSATVYRSDPGGGSVVPVRLPGRRIYSAMPKTSSVVKPPLPMKELATVS